MKPSNEAVISIRKLRASLFYDPAVRSIAFQALLGIMIVSLLYVAVINVAGNLSRAGVASGFGFFHDRAGFAINQSLIPYDYDSTYFRAFLVGLINTLIVAIFGIALSTVVGFGVGVGALSPNMLLRAVCTIYVETLRNVPLLLQLLFWYKAVLSALPPPKGSFEFIGDSIIINNRGVYIPKFLPEDGFSVVALALLIGLISSYILARWVRARQIQTGRQFPTFMTSLAIIVTLPVLAFLIMGRPAKVEYAHLAGFSVSGGMSISHEFLALLLGLSLYNASYIAEVLRAGITSVPKGQSEAARALGLKAGTTMRRVIIPQAMRVVIPPLTSQYINLAKNSSLAVAIGYPDLVAVFAGTVLNQTGQAIEIISITMLVYLSISLIISALMSWVNRSVMLMER